jgi:glycosyltransferase involved in cell wall biosynthesis
VRKNKIKIAHFISNLSLGGAERLVVDLSNELIKDKSIELFVCVYSENSNSFKGELNDSIKYLNFNKKYKIDFIFYFNLFKFFLKEKPNIVNSHLSGTILYLYFPMFFFKKILFFHTVHNLAQEELPNSFLQKIRKYFYQRKNLIPISISEATRQSHYELYNVDSSIVENGIIKKSKTEKFKEVQNEIELLKCNNDTKVFLSIGRINSPKDQKNYSLLIEVFKRLYSNHINVILVIIGVDSSKDQRTLKNLIAIKSDNTHFLGHRKNVTDYIITSDYYCLSSKFEGLPVTIIEAFSHGLPVISTNVGAVSEMVKDNVNGLLINDFKVDNYYNKVIEILNWNEDKRQKVRENNLNDFNRKYEIEITCKEYMKLYNTYLVKNKIACVV